MLRSAVAGHVTVVLTVALWLFAAFGSVTPELTVARFWMTPLQAKVFGTLNAIFTNLPWPRASAPVLLQTMLAPLCAQVLELCSL
jgi:hypothetical protein